MLTSNISTHVARLLCSRDKHLHLGRLHFPSSFEARGLTLTRVWAPTVAALRYLRIHLHQNNKNFVAHSPKQEVFKVILELALQESDRDTCTHSSCQVFFNHMCKVGVLLLVRT